MDKKKILDYQSIKKKIRRISLQILESNIDRDEIIIAGIDVNGFVIAKKISQEIRKIYPFLIFISTTFPGIGAVSPPFIASS